MTLHRIESCGSVRRDSEHRIVSATIPIHSLKACGLTQGTPLFTPKKRKIKTGGLRKLSKKNDEKVTVTFRLTEQESQKLKQCAAACGLSVAEFMRQLCKGNAPQPIPSADFWEMLDTLYEVHAAFKKCIPIFPSAAEICKEIEQLAVDLQQSFTMPQKISREDLFENGVV